MCHFATPGGVEIRALRTKIIMVLRTKNFCYIFYSRRLSNFHVRAHGKSMVHSGWWDSFAFFYWKNGLGNDGFLVKNGSFGTVLRFFSQTTINDK